MQFRASASNIYQLLLLSRVVAAVVALQRATVSLTLYASDLFMAE